MDRSLRSVLVAEGYGTFLLTFVGTMAITSGLNGGFVALAFGLALLAGIATVANVSGAYFNPAITLGMYASGRLPGKRVVPYVLAQLAGATIAAIVQLAIVGESVAESSDLGNTVPNIALPNFALAAVIAEIFGTMVLMMTVLGATDEGAPTWAPFGIGLTLTGLGLALGGVSGASFNPARSLGPGLISIFFDPSALNYYWIYVVGPVLGALLASGIYRTIRGR